MKTSHTQARSGAVAYPSQVTRSVTLSLRRRCCRASGAFLLFGLSIAAALFIIGALMTICQPASACTPDDFLCNAFAEPAHVKPAKPIGKPHPIIDDIAPADPKIVDYLDAIAGRARHAPPMSPDRQRQFLTIIFAHFDDLTPDWKRAICKTSYPDGVRSGAVDVAANQGYYAKCQAFAASEVIP